MDLYFILLGIAALGILALLLIFWGRNKKPAKKIIHPIAEREPGDEIITESSRSEPYISEDFNLEDHVVTAQSDQTLADLGFSALDGLLNDKPQVVPTSEPAVPLEPKQTTLNGREFIVFYLIAPNAQPFVGYELLQALLATGLRYGEMNIFHYYSDEEHAVKPLFSIASAAEPGTFDLVNIGAFSCPGLSIFLSVPNCHNIAEAFELMVDTALQLEDDLGGTLYDEDRQLLTEDLIDIYRSHIQ